MVTEWQDFTVVTKLITHFKNLYGSGGCRLHITDICMDFEPYFKVYDFVSVYPKSIKLGQMTTLFVIFHMVVSDYRLFKIWNSPQFPSQFRNGQLEYRQRYIEALATYEIGQSKGLYYQTQRLLLKFFIKNFSHLFWANNLVIYITASALVAQGENKRFWFGLHW